MSTFRNIKDETGHKERGAYIDLIIAAGVAIWYAWRIFQMQLSTPLTDVAFQGPMLRAVVISVVATIVLHIIYGILTGRSDTQEDQRDRQISRFGDWVSLFPLSAGALTGMILVMYDQHHFWIANAI